MKDDGKLMAHLDIDYSEKVSFKPANSGRYGFV
jgi:hypothetical protein